MNESTKPHSKLGIASCLIGLITFLLFVIAMACAYFGEEYRAFFRQQIGDETTYLRLLFLSVTIASFVPIPAHIVGLILGAVPLFSLNRKKLFPIVGVVLNLIFGVCALLPWLYVSAWLLIL